MTRKKQVKQIPHGPHAQRLGRSLTEQQLRCCPARFVWVCRAEGKGKLAVLATERDAPARGQELQRVFSDPLVARVTAFRNSSLQGAYLIIAARTGTGLRPDVRLQQRTFCLGARG